MNFTDPSFILGGGVNLFVTRHVALRPDVEAKLVRRNSQNYVVTAVSVHLAYHFEDHPMTPIPWRASARIAGSHSWRAPHANRS